MEAVAKAIAVIAAKSGQPRAALVEFLGGAPLGHQQNAILGQVGQSRQFLDLGEIFGRGHDELEPRFARGGQFPQDVGSDAGAFRHSGVREFGRDVELIDGGDKFISGGDGPIGLHFDDIGRITLSEEGDQFQPTGLLKKRLSAGENQAAAGECRDALGDFARFQLDGDVFLAVLLVAGKRVFFVRPWGTFEIPGVIGIAPMAVEVAAGGSDENGGQAHGNTFTLQGEEKFRAVAELREFHLAGLSPENRRLESPDFARPDSAMSIITGRGDDGETDLLFNRRIAKTSKRMEALGSVDELNAALGLARAAGAQGETLATVDQIQEKLVGLMGQLACLPEDAERYAGKGYALIRQEDVSELEAVAKRHEEAGVRFAGWARPGEEGSLVRAGLDHARAICRRAERAVLALHESGEPVPVEVRLYFNRLSDLLWILARVA